MANLGQYAINPLQAFQTGASLRGPSALGQMAMTLTQSLMRMQEARQTSRFETEEKIRSAGPIAEAEAEAKAKAQRKYPPALPTGAGDMFLSGASVGPEGTTTTFKTLAGLSAEGGGRFGLVTSGLRQIGQAKRILFPSGGPESMRRDLLGRIQTAPFGGSLGSKDAQDLEFLVSRAIEAQLRSESGAAVPEQEVKRATRNFFANVAAHPESALLRFTELERTLQSSQAASDPSGHLAAAVNRRITAFQLDARGLPEGAEELP